MANSLYVSVSIHYLFFPILNCEACKNPLRVAFLSLRMQSITIILFRRRANGNNHFLSSKHGSEPTKYEASERLVLTNRGSVT